MDKDALFEEREMKRQKIYNMEFDASFPDGNVLWQGAILMRQPLVLLADEGIRQKTCKKI